MDGVSIAYSTLHYLLKKVKSFTLFVTHYWLLTALEKEFPSTIQNYHMSFFENDTATDEMGQKLDLNNNNNNNNHNNNNDGEDNAPGTYVFLSFYLSIYPLTI